MEPWMDLSGKCLDDYFRCPNPIYWENRSILKYNTCIKRQKCMEPIINTPTYEVCFNCHDGAEIRKHFDKDYIHKPTQRESRIEEVTRIAKIRRKAKGEDAYSFYFMGGK